MARATEGYSGSDLMELASQVRRLQGRGVGGRNRGTVVCRTMQQHRSEPAMLHRATLI